MREKRIQLYWSDDQQKQEIHELYIHDRNLHMKVTIGMSAYVFI